ncbi:MAG: HEAT repeat domain-containing protein [Gemmataceae bacterium]
MPSAQDPSADQADWLTRRRRLDSILRLQAAVMVGDPAQFEAVRLLKESLSDPDVGVREAAAAALCEFGGDGRAALPELIRATQDENEVVRRRSVRALGFIADPVESADAVVPALVAATEDSDPGVSLQAMATLSEFGALAAPALPALMSAVWTGDVRRRALAGVALARLGELAVPSLAQSLEHPAAEVRAKAAHVLGKIGPAAAEAKPGLEKLLSDTDPTVHEEAAEALRLIG